jgi:hypothetical protein
MQTFESSKTRIYSVLWGISSIKKKMQHHILFSEETGMHFKVYSSRTSHHIHLIWRSALVKCTCMHMANRRKKESALTKALWFGISRKARTKLQSNEQVPKPKVFALPANYAEAKASLAPPSLFFSVTGQQQNRPPFPELYMCTWRQQDAGQYTADGENHATSIPGSASCSVSPTAHCRFCDTVLRCAAASLSHCHYFSSNS